MNTKARKRINDYERYLTRLEDLRERDGFVFGSRYKRDFFPFFSNYTHTHTEVIAVSHDFTHNAFDFLCEVK